LTLQAPTRFLTVLAVASALGMALQADLAGGAPADQEDAGTSTTKNKPVANKDKAAVGKDKAAASKDKASGTKDKSAASKGKDKVAASKAKDSKAKDSKAKDGKAKDAKTKDAKTLAPATTAKSQAPAAPLAVASPESLPLSVSSADVAAVKEAISATRKGRTSQAEDLQRTISDPVARKLVEWAILRSDETASVDFNRYMAFIAENSGWPAIGLLRRRAEATLWSDRLDPAFVRAFFGKEKPTTTKGKFALARALLLQGDRAAAQSLVREAWRNDNFSGDLESLAIDVFQDLITPADHKARMDMRLYAEDVDGGLRSANRAGGNALVIAKARIAVIKKAGNAAALLDAVPTEAHRDVGYIFSRVQFLRRAEKADEAAELILSIPSDHGQTLDSDQWWVERRLVARKLIDLGDVKGAYRIARDAPIPTKDNYRAESQFTAGWIALRFLNDPATALTHFAKLGQGNSNPITLSRAGYWQGRAAEALGRNSEARAHYEAAARYSTAYYGQIARARLGRNDIVVRPAPEPMPERRDTAARLEVAHAIELLYAIDERDLIAGSLADLGERSTDVAALAATGDVAARHKDARAMLLLGKSALGRGLPLEHYAFPTVGLPEYRAIGPEIEPAVAYAIARQESTFNPKIISSARAMGLMQVTPEAARYVTKKFSAPYDEKRLMSDQIYNVQLGAAELGDLIVDYRGSYILTFAGYNAGRGRVKEWIARYGDPRDPNVDPIDWVEQIPFSETRNYVQRVLENLQVYRVRFGGSSKLLIEADLRRGAAAN
jgi:soluble lytic murein transglycosylase